MRMMLQADIPNDPFNAMVKSGTAGAAIKKCMDAIKPEYAFFTEVEGHRTGVFIIDLKDASQIPSVAEPFFLTFNAKVHLRSVMLPEDLAKAGLEKFSHGW